MRRICFFFFLLFSLRFESCTFDAVDGTRTLKRVFAEQIKLRCFRRHFRIRLQTKEREKLAKKTTKKMQNNQSSFKSHQTTNKCITFSINRYSNLLIKPKEKKRENNQKKVQINRHSNLLIQTWNM